MKFRRYIKVIALFTSFLLLAGCATLVEIGRQASDTSTPEAAEVLSSAMEGRPVADILPPADTGQDVGETEDAAPAPGEDTTSEVPEADETTGDVQTEEAPAQEPEQAAEPPDTNAEQPVLELQVTKEDVIWGVDKDMVAAVFGTGYTQSEAGEMAYPSIELADEQSGEVVFSFTDGGLAHVRWTLAAPLDAFAALLDKKPVAILYEMLEYSEDAAPSYQCAAYRRALDHDLFVYTDGTNTILDYFAPGMADALDLSGVQKLTVTEFSQTYDNNELAFETNYAGALIQLRGRLGVIKRDESGVPGFELHGRSSTLYGTLCRFDERELAQLLTLKKGDTVTVAGIVSGMEEGRFILVRCVVTGG